jgi:AcrR family transcriptional regulator
MKLFTAQGYDTTTTEEIAEKAGVSVRTFFRYFATKESVLFQGQRAWFQSFAEIYRGQPESLSDADAMCAALIEAVSGLSWDRRSLRMFERAVATSPTLRGRAQDYLEQNVAEVAEAIAARRGLPHPDKGSTLLAAVGVLTYRRALDAWIVGPTDAKLGDVIAEEFGLLRETFAQNKLRPGVPKTGQRQAYGAIAE